MGILNIGILNMIFGRFLNPVVLGSLGQRVDRNPLLRRALRASSSHGGPWALLGSLRLEGSSLEGAPINPMTVGAPTAFRSQGPRKGMEGALMQPKSCCGEMSS